MSEYETTTDPNKSRITILKHRLIWIQNYGEIPEGMIIHHKNGKKKDNRLNNLKIVSRSEHSKEHWKRKKLLLLKKEDS